MILFCIALAMYGSSMNMLQNNVAYQGEDLISPVTNNYFVDLVLGQYLLSLGDFSYDSF